MKIKSLKEVYEKETVKVLEKELGRKNALALPRIEKVIVNVGLGKMHKEGQYIKDVVQDLTVITGQKPSITQTKKAIAGFKVRQGATGGAKITLRKQRMWDFLDRLVHVTLPRTRDFQGLPVKNIDSNGNLNIGIREHNIFPEIKPEKVARNFGLEVTIVTSAQNDTEGYVLFKSLGFPLQENKKK
jgi:large subunit ribosomal protein L5